MRTAVLLAMLAIPFVGCRSSETSVSGNVTVNGRPLERGCVTFFPVGSTKATRGAPVTDGAYKIVPMACGRFQAVVAETPDVQVAHHTDGPPMLSFRSISLMPTTPGNQQLVEIRPGKQTLDFALQTQ